MLPNIRVVNTMFSGKTIVPGASLTSTNMHQNCAITARCDENGRLARMLSTLMALQAGIPPLDFGGVMGQRRREYFAAVRAGLDRDYRPMERIFNLVLKRTRRIVGKT